jgi:hypothetical protein
VRTKPQPAPQVNNSQRPAQILQERTIGSAGAISDEVAKRLYDRGAWLRKFLDRTRFSRDLPDELAQFFREYSADWFRTAIHLHEGLRPLDAQEAISDRDMAFDVWIFVGLWRMQCSDRFHTLAWLTLYDYMCACDAPLLRNYQDATRVRKRTIKRVSKAIALDSGMSAGWRLRWFERFPLTWSMLLCFPPQRLRLQRVSRRSPRAIRSV